MSASDEALCDSGRDSGPDPGAASRADGASPALVVMSWGGGWGRALRKAVSDPFTEQTGIAVHHEHHVGLALPATLINALQRRERPPFDVVWCNAVPAMRLGHAGLCEPLTEEEVPNLAFLHPKAKPEGFDGWPVVMAYMVFYVLAYRRAAFPGAPPESWEVLLDPRHRNRIALYPGGNGFYPVAQVLGGGRVRDIPDDMEACWRFVRQLAPQIGALDYSIGMGEVLRRGELDMCFRALPNALAFRDEGLDVSWAAPREGVPDTMDAFLVPHCVPPDTARWAKRYIDFALSRAVQERWCEMLGVLPIRRDLPASRVVREHPGMTGLLDDEAGLLHVPERIKLAHEEAWAQQFNRILGWSRPSG